ncbi:MAG: 2-polyprenyl-3-methyl-5-hydroxy-6-metoxy-1,4-benzoquinol methylase [Myxococcota bacterium]|jgi:2-polyprenyl-3-methyl-5-hydroxy-6-metoxy-1,4-benzoquinol methylase
MSDFTSAVCLVCGDTSPRLRYQITRFQVLACTKCPQIYLYPLPGEEEIHDLFAELYATGGGSVPELKSYYGFCYDDTPSNPLVQLYESWLSKIEEHHAPGRMLDVGSGTGLFLALAKRRGWEVYGIDGSVEATDYARQNFGLDLWVGDFADFGRRNEQFDVITGWDIIEHSRDPVALLEEMRGSLAPGGSIVLSTPDQHSILDVVAGAFYRLSGGASTSALEKFYIEQHFLYFTHESLTHALRLARLDVRSIEPEVTDLRRLTLNPVMRLILMAMFFFAKRVGLENRILVMAKASGDD